MGRHGFPGIPRFGMQLALVVTVLREASALMIYLVIIIVIIIGIYKKLLLNCACVISTSRAASIRGWPLVRSALGLCGGYSRAATKRGAASIR